jgi:hypothetical protein
VRERKSKESDQRTKGDAGEASNIGSVTEEEAPNIIECSSPPCMLHELNEAFVEHAELLPRRDGGQGRRSISRLFR